ncbi:DUF11 domain-containing protein [Chloroflexi bacterium TSY]|nr:DUF11 domain-containing protein [Chloroflexi bacterium TSY]
MQLSHGNLSRFFILGPFIFLFFLLGFIFAQATVAAESHHVSSHSAFEVPALQPTDTCFATPDDGITKFGSPDASALQRAIDQLDPLSDTVRTAGICTGVINRNGITQTVYISRSLRIVGDYMPDEPSIDPTINTLIDADCLGRAFVIDGDIDVILENLDITCGDASGLSGPVSENFGNGGGLLVNGSNVTLINTRIYGNSANNGGGAFIGSTLTVGAGSIISNNVATDGGGVYVNSTATTSALVLDGGAIINNIANRDGGGAYIDDATAVYTQTSGTIGGNQATRDGGGLYINQGQATLLGGDVISNTALNFEGGGIYMETITGTLFISNTQILYNQSRDDDGGGITTNGGMTMINSEVAYNFAFRVGGGIDNDVEGQTLIIDSFIHDNIAEDEGGGIDSDAPLEIRNTRIMTNETTFVGPDGGGGIHSSDLLTVTKSLIENNRTVGRGGGMYLTGGIGETVLISDSQIIGNFAEGDGGGIRSRATLTIIRSTIQSNRSLEDGGGLDEDSSKVTMRDSVVQFNFADEDGGGLEINTDLTIENSTVYSNVASNFGGGIFQIGPPAQMTIDGSSQIDGNFAVDNGGGIANILGTLTIEDSSVSFNGMIPGASMIPCPSGCPGPIVPMGPLTLNSGGIFNADGTVLLRNTDMISNTVEALGGGLYNWGTPANLTVTDDSLLSQNIALFEAGGAVANISGTVMVSDTILSDNFAGLDGGGFYNESGIATVDNSLIQENVSLDLGGGICNYYLATLTIRNSQVISNEATLYGGIGSEMSTLFVYDTLVQGNVAAEEAGGIASERGTATIERTIITNNSVISGTGGGLLNADGGLLMLVDSQVRNNDARDGGGISNLGGVMTIEGSEVSNNQAGFGGGIFNTAITGTLSITNTTISGNSAMTTTGGIHNSAFDGIRGFHVYPEAGTVNLFHVTLNDNSSDGNVGNFGGTINVEKSILGTMGSFNCLNADPFFNSVGGSIYSDDSCGSAAPTDLIDTEPELMALADNGGPLLQDGTAPRSHALQLTSPAVDFVHCELPDDQRDAVRAGAFSSLCDSGAFEAQAVQVDVAVRKTVTPSTANPGQPITYTITFSNTGNVTARNVVLTDSVPPTISVSSVISSGVNVTQSGVSPYLWNVDELAVAETGTITLTGVVSAALTTDTTFVNTVTITATDDLTDTNNNGSASLNVLLPRVQLDSTSVVVDEGVGTLVMTATLDMATPYRDVTVDYATGNGTALEGSDYAHRMGSATIPAGSTIATFTIPITDDLMVELDETLSVTLSAPNGALFGSPNVATVMIQDNDAASLSIDDVTLMEGDSGITNFVFTVTLDQAVDSGFTLEAISSDGSASSGTDYAMTNTLLTFNGAMGETQMVTVPVVGDLVGEVDETFRVTLSTISSSGRNVTIGDGIGLGTIENDDAVGIVLNPIAFTISEPNTVGLFTIALSSQPTMPVTVTLTSTDLSECIVPSAVVLNSGNWQGGVTVSVTAVDDSFADGSQLCTVQTTAMSSDPAYDGLVVEDVSVTVADNDGVGILVNPSTLTLSEPASTGFFTITLTSEPTDTVTIDFTSLDLSECAVPANVMLDAGNWQSGIAVMVTAVDDALVDGSQLCTVQTSVTSNDPGYQGAAVGDISVTVMDDDGAGILVGPTSFILSEPTSSGITTIRLTSEPTATVTIHLVPSDTSECMAPASVELNAVNWQSGVDVTIQAEDDNLADGSQVCLVQTLATSSDPAYDAVSVDDISVRVDDDEIAGILVSPSTLMLNEPGTSDLFTIRLTSEPSGTVTINLTSSDTSECTVPMSVELDPTNWQSGVTVTVRAEDDDLVDSTQLCVVETVATSSDLAYDGVTVADNDGGSVLVNPTFLTLSEPASTDFFTITLTSEPTATVLINLVSLDDTECTAPATAMLDRSNWQSGVSVTVTAVDDHLIDGTQPCTIQTSVVSEDPVYHGLAAEDVAVTVADDDAANRPPMIADQDFTVDENSPVGTLVGTVVASDPDDGQTLIYRMTTSLEVSLNASIADSLPRASEINTSFVIDSLTGQITVAGSPPDYESVARYILTVQVTDSGTPALPSSAMITILIRNVNEAPVIVNPIPSQQAQSEAAFSFIISSDSFADPDLNDPLTYSAILDDGSSLPGWLTFDPVTGTFSGIPTAPDTLTIRVTATDRGGLQASSEFTISISAPPTDIDEIDEPKRDGQIFLPLMIRG